MRFIGFWALFLVFLSTGYTISLEGGLEDSNSWVISVQKHEGVDVRYRADIESGVMRRVANGAIIEASDRWLAEDGQVSYKLADGWLLSDDGIEVHSRPESPFLLRSRRPDGAEVVLRGNKNYEVIRTIRFNQLVEAFRLHDDFWFDVGDGWIHTDSVEVLRDNLSPLSRFHEPEESVHRVVLQPMYNIDTNVTSTETSVTTVYLGGSAVPPPEEGEAEKATERDAMSDDIMQYSRLWKRMPWKGPTTAEISLVGNVSFVDDQEDSHAQEHGILSQADLLRMELVASGRSTLHLGTATTTFKVPTQRGRVPAILRDTFKHTMGYQWLVEDISQDIWRAMRASARSVINALTVNQFDVKDVLATM